MQANRKSFTLKTLCALIALVISAACLYGCGNKTSACNSYKLDCIYNAEAGTLVCDMQFIYVNNTDTAIDALKFNLFPNAYREGAKYAPVSVAHTAKAYYAGKSYGDITITDVVCGNTREYTIGGEDENILTVGLPTELFPGEKTTVSMTFTVKLAKINHRLGITPDAVNLGNFYPILCGYDSGFYECLYYSVGDPFYSETADYDVTLTAPESYTVAASGKIVSASTEGGFNRVRYKIDNARDFAMVLSQKFEVITAKACGTEISYYYISDDNAAESLEYAVKAIETFTELYGEYPYPTYAVVQTGFTEGGMEYPALVYIQSSLERSAYGEVIVHETAHQWWYGVVGNNEVEYGFLDEGLAEYSVVLFYEKRPEYGLTRELLITSAEKTYQIFCSVHDRLFGKVDSTMLRALGEYSSEYEYVNIAYIKGCLMFDYLRQTVGDAKFFVGLQKYYKEYSFKIAEPDDLVGVYEKSGADTNGFFESFYQGKVII